MSLKDHHDSRREYRRKLDAILSWAKQNKWFNTRYVVDIVHCLNNYKFLTPDQQLGIDNIIEKFDIKWDLNDKEG